MNNQPHALAPRVYWLTEQIFPPQIGGQELMGYYLTQGLAACGFLIQVITRQPDAICPFEEWVGPVRVRRLMPNGTLKGGGWQVLPQLLSYLARIFTLLMREAQNYDVVIISGMKIIPLVAVPVCGILGKKCIVRVESSYELVEPISSESLGMSRWLSKVLMRAMQTLQHAVVSRAYRVIAISTDIEQRLMLTGYSPARIAKIPNATDLSKFHPLSQAERGRLRERLRVPVDRAIAVFIARLSRAKGIMTLIEAWPDLVVRHRDLHLVIVGNGTGSFDNCEAELTWFIREKGLSDHAVMVGASDCVHEYLQAADFYILPSEYEGFSVGLVEALASALPCVVTAVGAAPQLIREAENGFLFAPKNKAALIRAVEECLAHRNDWPEIGRRARESTMPFDLPRVVEQYGALCRSPY